ncbi:hypothetical protein [Brucella anthropi]|uniref:hypothetical protein n=1 Tax=Brucella anthropi TaxID=529 RepID=UPI000CFAA9BB|nr:hypothetical protein [Ochrobactrum sp. MYb49]PQZ62728.1 hypothetical protein CQ057_14880 [Ochrobactrum sp. MYb49]
MSISDYPADIQKAADDALEAIDIDSRAPGEGIVRSYVEEAIAYAIKQERIRCIELAYKNYVYTPNREGAQALSFAIAEGKRA